MITRAYTEKATAPAQHVVVIKLWALDADIPVVIAVASEHFADWIKFAGGMSVKLACDRSALDQWWRHIRETEAPKKRLHRQTDRMTPRSSCEGFLPHGPWQPSTPTSEGKR